MKKPAGNIDRGVTSPRWYKGNINLYNRPQYVDPKTKKVSTVRSISFSDESGKEVLVPTIVRKNGKPVRLTDKQAINRYYKTGKNLGKYNSVAEANRAARLIHEQQAKFYGVNK